MRLDAGSPRFLDLFRDRVKLSVCNSKTGRMKGMACRSALEVAVRLVGESSETELESKSFTNRFVLTASLKGRVYG